MYSLNDNDAQIDIYTARCKKGVCIKGLYPVLKINEADDVKTSELIEALDKEGCFYFEEIFLDADYSVVKKMADDERLFHGVVYTDNSPYEVTVKVVQNKTYLEEIKKLYKVFRLNNQKWKTVYAPDFHRMFKIYIIETDLPWYEEVKKIDIDFEEYSEFVQKDINLYWNVKTIKIIPDIKPEYDTVMCKYVQTLNPKRLAGSSYYLVSELEEDIDIRGTERGLQIFCDLKKSKIWPLYKINRDVDDKSILCGNGQKENHIYPVRTIAGVHRYLRNMEYVDCFEIMSISTEECSRNRLLYDMNPGCEELLGARSGLPKLKIVLRQSVADRRNNDLVSYFQSELQRSYPMYFVNIILI